jgi:glycosyltransferase involved in cell wall biosynthesis
MTKNKPKVSVCLPTYNSGNNNFLETAINSILNQSFDDFELIIVDDFSTDNTREIIKSYLGRDRRIKYYENEMNLGLFPNWNKCLNLTTGEYITILGQDDLMQPDNLLKKVAILEQYSQVGLVTSSVQIIDDYNNITTWEWANYPNSYVMNGQEWLMNTVGEANPICCPAVMFRKSVLDKIGKQFDLNYDYTADLKMWVEIAKVSDLYFLTDFLINYRWHETNTTHRFTALKQVSENLQVWGEFLDDLLLSDYQLFNNILTQQTIQNLENIAITRAIQWITVHRIYPLLESNNLQSILELYNYLFVWRNKPLDMAIFFQALIDGMKSILETKSRLEIEVKNYVTWVNEEEQKFLDAQAEIKKIMTWAEGLDRERLELIENVKRLQDEKLWLESQVKVWMETAQQYYNKTQFNKTH